MKHTLLYLSTVLLLSLGLTGLQAQESANTAAANPSVINASNGENVHYVGELYGGGVVFRIDQTGQHGLVLSITNLSAAQLWSNVSSTPIGASAQNDRDGLNYWSSTESNANNAWYYFFNGNSTASGAGFGSKDYDYHVRAVRAF